MNSPTARASSALQIRLAQGAALFTVLLWASAFPLIHLALRGLGPVPLAAARFSLAAMVGIAWLLMRRPALPSRRDTATFLACGLIGIALYSAFLNSGQRTVSPGAASFLINTGPIITALLATAFLGERFGAAAWLGSVVALGGVAIIAAGQPGGLTLGAGASLILLAALCQATYFTIQKPLVPRYGALACTAYTIIGGALLLTPWLPEAVRSISTAGLNSTTTRVVFGLVIFPSVLGYASWTYALGTLGAARAANFLYLVPPVASALSYGLTGEAPTSTTVIGGLLAIAGVAVVNLRSTLGSKRAPADEKAALGRALARAAGTWGGYQAARPVPLGRSGDPKPSCEVAQKDVPLNCRAELARL